MEKEARTWAMAAHLSVLSGFIIPFGNLIAPLVIWLIKKDEFPFVNDQGKEALNFQITMSIAAVISGVLTMICIGIPMLIAVAILNIVFPIIAGIKANDGIEYRYPYTLRLIK